MRRRHDVRASKTPHLAITKDATETSYDAVGDVINYTIVATNDGNVTLANVTVTDPNVSEPQLHAGQRVAAWPRARRSPARPPTRSPRPTSTPATTSTPPASMTARAVPPRRATTSPRPGAKNPHLAITKDATETSYNAVGEVIHYTIVATNDGNTTLAR